MLWEEKKKSEDLVTWSVHGNNHFDKASVVVVAVAAALFR